MSRNRVIAGLVLAAVIGWTVRGAVESYETKHDRPFLRALVKFAKFAGWVFLVADDAPAETPAGAGPEQPSGANLLIGIDGYPLVDHRSAM